jgi:NADH dehydrogenase/NADH:ubiquinone oxidoreductase subunit G
MKRAIYFALLGVVTTVALAAKEPFKREETIESQATVEAIYPESRLLVLNGEAGSAVIAAGPEVKNFAQIKVGDKVKVAYKAAMAAKISKSKEDPKTTVDAAAYTAPAGSMPAAAVGQTIKTTVQIEAVDTSFETVSFKRPDGLVRTIAPASPEGKKFIRTLKKGDMVDVEYTEALAISVVPGG